MATNITVQLAAFEGNTGALTMDAADIAGNEYDNDGRTIVVLHNTDAGAHNVTVTSVADEFGRTGDQVFSLAADEHRAVSPLIPSNWNQSTGRVLITADSATVEIAVIRLPVRP